MFSSHFYHQRVRKSVSMFGSLFNNLYVVRQNSSGASINQVRVPLSYAPKRDFIERIREMDQNEDNERQVAIKLPRMSFEIVSIDYDNQFQLPKTNRILCTNADGSTAQKIYTKTPYNIQFELSIYARSQDDALQVVEQIIPYFAPQYSMGVFPIPEAPTFQEDVPVRLDGITFSDDYEGPLEQRRTIIYTLAFEMKVGFYGPVADQPIIREVVGDIFDIDAGLNDSDLSLGTYQYTPNPLSANPDSDWTLDTTYYGPLDSSP